MSYAGREQKWCARGHYFEESAHTLKPRKRCFCGAKFVYENQVDDTNGDAWGYIKPKQITPPHMCICAHCNNKHVAVQPVYQIPDETTPRFAATVVPRGTGTARVWIRVDRR